MVYPDDFAIVSNSYVHFKSRLK